MNYRRIILGGLLAGLLVCASEWLMNGVVLADRMSAEMERMGLHFASWAMPAYIVMAFAYGLLVAWVYAAIRPRFGPGARTAAIAAAAVWVLAYLMPTVGFLAMGSGSAQMYGISLLWGAVELLLAGLIAGYIYRET